MNDSAAAKPAIELAMRSFGHMGQIHRLALANVASCERLFQLALLSVLALTTNQLRGQTDPGPMLMIGKPSWTYACGLYASGPGATNFVLQASADLRSWTNLFQVYGHPGTNPVFVADLRSGQGFWRATAGEPLVVQAQRWTDREPVEYSFYLRRMISFWQGGVRGTVRVLDGKIADVTDAIDDRTLEPISNPDVSQFLTITQVFEQIGQAFEAGAEQVSVWYDPSGLYPARVVIDPLIRAADDDSIVEVSDLTVLQP
ncbi:MAG: DUF6174 domain-containing protein [Limisphaerales bacterium]